MQPPLETQSRVLSDDRFDAALERIQGQIRDGLVLHAVDDNDYGSKSTSCNWGMCSQEPTTWPDPEDKWRDFPGDPEFDIPDQIWPKERVSGQHCPMDRLEEDKYQIEPSGCFWRCRVFNPLGTRPTKEEAIQLYQVRIDERRPDGTNLSIVEKPR